MHVCNPAHRMNLCNVLQSGPIALTSYWPFCNLLFWNLCSASAIQLLSEPMQRPLPSSSFSFVVLSKLSTKHITPGFPRIQVVLACSTSDMFQNSSNGPMSAPHGTNPVTFLFRWLRPSKLLSSSIQIANLKSQIPSFCFSLWATRQRKTTLPFYSSLRILCKVW